MSTHPDLSNTFPNLVQTANVEYNISNALADQFWDEKAKRAKIWKLLHKNNLINSRANSYPKKLLGDKSPFDSFAFFR